jgi:hypothetical protein
VQTRRCFPRILQHQSVELVTSDHCAKKYARRFE